MSARVATYNVHHGAPRRGRIDLAATIDACRSLRADLLALQELDVASTRSEGVDQPAAIAEALGMHLAFAATVQLRDGGTYGHALLSRHELRDVELVALRRDPDREPRLAIVATTGLDGIEVSVCAMHLQNHRWGEPVPALALDQLDEALDALATRDHPRVALGDLNLEPAQVAAHCAAHGLARAPSGPTLPPHRPTATPDHIALAGLGIATVSVPRLEASDHLPIVIELAIDGYGTAR